jgi:hypothetical protein
MEFKFQKRRGIGNVITTLIILIASVVLGAGVIFFGGSMFQSNTQSESIKVSNVHSWVAGNSTQTGLGGTTAFVVQNTGSKAVTINSISLRGISVPTSAWYYSTTAATASNIQTELPADFTENSITIGGTTYSTPTDIVNPGPISLSQGQAAIVYLDKAGNIQPIDSGNTYALQIQAGQATAVQQVSVETK